MELPQANLTIPSKASLGLTGLSVSRSRVSTGQSFTVTATIQNNGQLQGRVTQLTVGLPSGLAGGTFSGSTNIAPGSVGTIPVTVTATSAGAYSLTTVTFAAIDTTSNLALPVAANSATPRAVTDPSGGLGVPIVPGEVGTGPFGLCNTLPAALTGTSGEKRGAIVYGHGLFTLGAVDFRDAFATLMGVEHFCRAEYFRRVARLGGE